jgi:hypothetical protein
MWCRLFALTAHVLKKGLVQLKNLAGWTIFRFSVLALLQTKDWVRGLLDHSSIEERSKARVRGVNRRLRAERCQLISSTAATSLF